MYIIPSTQEQVSIGYQDELINHSSRPCPNNPEIILHDTNTKIIII